jgi:hypothetical protein
LLDFDRVRFTDESHPGNNFLSDEKSIIDRAMQNYVTAKTLSSYGRYVRIHVAEWKDVDARVLECYNARMLEC